MDIIFIILEYIKTQVDNNFYFSFICISFFLFIYNSFSIPGNTIFMVAIGYFFGIYLGYLISISTLVLGSLIFFIFSSVFLEKISPKTIVRYSGKIDQYISNSAIEYLIIFRMIPGPPLFLQNLILSLLKISKTKFLLSSFIGFSPLVFILVFFGHNLSNFNYIKTFRLNDILSLKFILFIFFIIILLVVRIIFIKRKK